MGEIEKAGLPTPKIVIRDNDSKFGGGFDDELAEQGLRTERLPVQAPLCNAHMERWIQSLRRECLDHFVPLGLKHLDHLVAEYLEHYHLERPHQGLGNRLLEDRMPGHDPPRDEGEVMCRVRLGGVLRHYERRLAARNGAGPSICTPLGSGFRSPDRRSPAEFSFAYDGGTEYLHTAAGRL